MAQQFLSYIYQIVSAGGTTTIKAAGGEPNTFASAAVHIYPTTETGGINNIQLNSIIQILPTGLNQQSTKYYSAESVSALQTKANA